MMMKPSLVTAPRNEFEDYTAIEFDINSQSKSKELNFGGFLFKYILSFLAASCSEFVTYPLDLAKTRLQLQGEKAFQNFDHNVKIGKKRGLINIGVGIVKEEGFLCLWKGITPAVYRHLVYSGCRMTIYEFIREEFLNKNRERSVNLWKSVISGALAGGIAQFLASPADLIKVQVQMEGQRKLQGLQPRVEGAKDAFYKIVQTGGLKGLWKGWAPNVQRAVFVNLGDLVTYDIAKQIILTHTPLQDNTLTYALSSTASGLVAATFGTPADFIKARIMNQPTDKHGRGLLYRSSFDCLLQSIKNEGFLSLYKGFVPCWLRMGPWSMTFWLTYEELRKLFGVKSF